MYRYEKYTSFLGYFSNIFLNVLKKKKAKGCRAVKALHFEIICFSLCSVDVGGIAFSASNMTSIGSVNVTMESSNAENLTGIFQGYVVFYKEVEEEQFKSKRILSAKRSHLITGLKDWTAYLVFVRVVTLNGAGRKSESKLGWTKFTGRLMI